MTTFFEKNQQNYTQHGYPRRGGGHTAAQITVHTYEAPYTRSLLAAATWLLQRDTPGSYHALCGDDSPTDVLQLAPWSHETWHSTPNNKWAIGISMVTYASQWGSLPAASRSNLVKSAAYAAATAAQWLQEEHGRKVESRILTRAQAMRKESGFVSHATMDPGRRTDPGADFPWEEFLTEFNRLMGGVPTFIDEQEDDMAKAIIFSSTDTADRDHQYIAFPNAREYEYIEDTQDRDDFKNVLSRQGFLVETWKNASGSSSVGNPDVFGRYVGPASTKPKEATR